MPFNYVGIRFNENGICNYCSDYRSREYLGKDALAETIDKILLNTKNRKYDCSD